MDKKSKQIGLRLDEKLMTRLKNFEKITNVPLSILVRNAIEVALDQFERDNKITFPLAEVAVPKKRKSERVSK